MSPQTPSGGQRRLPQSSIARAPALALLGGAAWSVVPLLRGGSLADWPWFIASGALLLWLLLLAWTGFSAHRSVVGGVALTTALLLGFGIVFGATLFTHTHHRPLAAVTWIMGTCVAAVGSYVVVQRLRPRTELAVGALGMFGAFALWRSAGALDAGLLLETGSGAVALAACFWLGRRWGARLQRGWWLPASLIVAGCLGAMAFGSPERLHQVAPVVAGPIGLFY